MNHKVSLTVVLATMLFLLSVAHTKKADNSKKAILHYIGLKTKKSINNFFDSCYTALDKETDEVKFYAIIKKH